MNGDTAPERPVGAKVPNPCRPLLATHSGTFHLDDTFAYAVLRLALGLGAAGVDHALVRTRDEAVVAEADVAWDVGAVHDAAAGRFDHHQRGAPVREDGCPTARPPRFGSACSSAHLPCSSAALPAAALVLNVAAAVPIPYRTDDAHVPAVWLFRCNEATGNAAVVVAASLLW
jgi:hypothetical protein